MKNSEIYHKTLPIALLRLGISALGLLLLFGLPVAAFLLTANNAASGAVWVSVAFLVGLIAMYLLNRYLGYLLKAGQIAMITKGITDNELPDHIVEAGKAAVKKRFLTANLYFALSRTISLITNQITRGINAAAGLLGGLGDDTTKGVVGGIGAVISTFISIVLEYVNYCCLGWVFRNGDQNAFKSTCDGAVIYFQNWKVLLKNAGKVFGIGLVSLIVIGVPVAYLGFKLMAGSTVLMGFFSAIATEMEIGVTGVAWVAAGFAALCVWGVLNSAFIKPYVLVSVLRSYIEAADQNPPKLDIYGKLCGISSRFKQTYEQAQAQTDAEAPAVQGV